ncbi:MAG: hypothetical protein COV44_10310 [Deltaproteobacteria bacterium CG11_big_fil_rev_8_21_14_0_20_45_16]|nr:MAG: hypothetical protein COV44_10310 [Deltaproteobacteria bacterium CG11_big_fil_rev_8_21_14_0_20_45_16]
MIRWKVFLPVFVIVALSLWFCIYRIDFWLKGAFENAISAVTGTKTDITYLRVSFRQSSLTIKKLEIASSKEEFKNAMEFSDIVIDFQSLPLLEKRFVVDDFSIKGITWGTPRKKSGFLPPQPKEDKPSWYSKWADEAMSKVKSEFDQLPVAKLADFRVPTNVDEILTTLNLESEKALRAALVSAQESKTEWTKTISELKDVSEYREMFSQVQRAASSTPQTPAEILEKVKVIQTSISFFENETKKADELLRQTQNEWKKLQATYKMAADSIEEDYKRAKAIVSLDQFDLNNLSRLMFGSQWMDRAEQVLQYHAMIRHYLALMKPKEEARVEVRQRAQGRDIIFISPKRKPSFVLAHSGFSVTGLENNDAKTVSQTYELELKDLNSNPRLYGKPTEVDLDVRFKNWILGEAKLDMFWDYTGTPIKDRYKLEASRIAASNWPVGIPKIFPVTMEKGVANSSSLLSFVDDEMKWTNRVNFEDIAWDFREVPRIGFIIPAISEVLQRIKNFFVEFEILRKEGDFDFIVRSDLDDKMQKALMEVIEEKWKDFQAKLKLAIEEKVEKYRKETLAEIDRYKKDVLGQVEEKKKLAENYQKQAEAKLKEVQNIAEKKKKELQNKVKKEAGDRLKNITKQAPKIKLPF